MGELAERLATLVLGDSASAQEASRALTPADKWGDVVALADVWRVIPALRRQATALPLHLTETAERALRERSVRAAVQTTAVAYRAAVVCDALRAAAIPCAAFKGIGVIGNLYRSPAERMVNDIDLLIDPRHLESAHRVLTRLGFSPVVDRIDAFVEYLDGRPLEGVASGNHFAVFIDADHIEVDLHWELGIRPAASFGCASIIARAESVRLYGYVVPVAVPADAILLTVHHAVRSNFVPSSTVKDLLDLAYWWECEGLLWQARTLIERARDCGLAAPLWGLWRTLDDLDPGGAAGRALGGLVGDLSPVERRDGDHLRHLFRLQLRDGDLNTDLLQLLSRATLTRFLRRRVRHARATVEFTNRIEQVLGLAPHRRPAQRLAELLRTLGRLNPRTIAGYRALLRAHGVGRRPVHERDGAPAAAQHRTS